MQLLLEIHHILQMCWVDLYDTQTEGCIKHHAKEIKHIGVVIKPFQKVLNPLE